MATGYEVLDAYHRAIGRHERKTGVSWPLVRASCVNMDERTIVSTDTFQPELLATFTMDDNDRPRIKLV
jgi:hypothetical protein